MRNIVIIGNGISGITAARHIRKKSDDPITIISAETDHFFSRTALMYIYMGHMKYEHTKPYEDWFWEKNRFKLIRGFADRVNATEKTVHLSTGEILHFDILIIASGSKPVKLGCPGENLKGVQGLYSYQDLESMRLLTKHIDHAVVVGGGLIGIEMTEMLLSRNIYVSLLVREDNFWDVVLPCQEAEMVSRNIRDHGVDLRTGTELKLINGTADGRIRSIVTSHNEEIPCQFAGITIGVHPNIDFLNDCEIETGDGIPVDQFFETSHQGIYAIGDCARFRDPLPGRKAIEQVWYTGRIHGETVAETILGNKTAYRPGPWFNSAKFLDIEYQVYGDIKNDPHPEDEHIYWEDIKTNRSVRLVYDAESKNLKGINVLGVRFNHRICDEWIRNQVSIETVMTNLGKAVFEPEFSRDVIRGITESCRKTHPGIDIPRKSKKGLASIFHTF